MSLRNEKALSSKAVGVQRFFSDSDRYLRDNYHIPVRAFIVQNLLGNVNSARVLDVGCGDGSISMPLLSRGNRITLIDQSSSMLDRAKANTPKELSALVEYVNMNFLDLEAPGQYDIVLCIGVLAHVESISQALAKLATFLKPGGYCVLQITDTDQLSGWLAYYYYQLCRRLLNSDPYTLNRIGISEVISMAAQNGLLLTRKQRFLLPLPSLGMRRFAREWLVRFSLLTVRSRMLSRWSSEAMLLLTKTG